MAFLSSFYDIPDAQTLTYHRRWQRGANVLAKYIHVNSVLHNMVPLKCSPNSRTVTSSIVNH